MNDRVTTPRRDPSPEDKPGLLSSKSGNVSIFDSSKTFWFICCFFCSKRGISICFSVRFFFLYYPTSYLVNSNCLFTLFSFKKQIATILLAVLAAVLSAPTPKRYQNYRQNSQASAAYPGAYSGYYPSYYDDDYYYPSGYYDMPYYGGGNRRYPYYGGGYSSGYPGAYQWPGSYRPAHNPFRFGPQVCCISRFFFFFLHEPPPGRHGSLKSTLRMAK